MSLDRAIAIVEWTERVRAGEFGAIPAPLRFEDAIHLGHLLSGYDLRDDLADLTNASLARVQGGGVWYGSALELWLCLFFECRRWRHFGETPHGVDAVHLDALCEALRQRLLSVTPVEREELVRLLREHPGDGGQPPLFYRMVRDQAATSG
jgi:hypothetical protein